MGEYPFVSVVMPVHNASATMRESIESVLSQIHGHLELLVVDDGSSDGSADIADACAAKDARLRVFRCAHRGVVHARNFATEHSRGRFIAFCDSDDLWHPEKLARQLSFMWSRRAVISATGFQRIDESGRPISGPVHVPPVIRYADMLVMNRVCCASVVYDVEALGKVRMIDYREAADLPLYMRLGGPKPLHEDYIAWASILATGVDFAGLDEVLTYYRVRGDSHSANKAAAAVARWYINRHVLDVTLRQNISLMIRYSVGSIWRRFRWRLESSGVMYR